MNKKTIITIVIIMNNIKWLFVSYYHDNIIQILHVVLASLTLSPPGSCKLWRMSNNDDTMMMMMAMVRKSCQPTALSVTIYFITKACSREVEKTTFKHTHTHIFA